MLGWGVVVRGTVLGMVGVRVMVLLLLLVILWVPLLLEGSMSWV